MLFIQLWLENPHGSRSDLPAKNIFFFVLLQRILTQKRVDFHWEVTQQSGQVATFLLTIEIEVAIENELKPGSFPTKLLFYSKFSIIEWCLFRFGRKIGP